jgi:cell filamentation protein
LVSGANQLNGVINRMKLKAADWSKIDKKAYLNAMHASTTDSKPIKSLLKQAITDQITDRELFMKGIDYSYYYEQAE